MLTCPIVATCGFGTIRNNTALKQAYLLGYSSVKNEVDLKVAVLDETLKKLHVIKDNMILRESDEGPNLLEFGLGTAIAAIEGFKKEIEAQKDE